MHHNLDWIAKNGGMALLNIHPDYIFFANNKLKMDEFPINHYQNFLEYVKFTYQDKYLNILPRILASNIKSIQAPNTNNQI
jgi:hypothetical protein